MKIDVKQVPIRVPGYRFGAAACGLKASGKRDIGLIVSDEPATAVAAFTTNRVQAAPVLLGKERIRGGRVQAVLVNSGNANAYTGRDGLRLARELCALAAQQLGISRNLVIPSSTGRIGVQLPREAVRKGVTAACRDLSADGFHRALEGIMTTDAFPKFAVEGLMLDGRDVTIAGMAKGAGMIAPRMVPHATLLSYILTDARVSRTALRKVLDLSLPQSFNAAVVDGDTSTNDTVLLLANGVAGNRELKSTARDFAAFAGAVGRIMRTLARMVVKDGEGATKLIDITVRRARTVADAERVADAIARSPLCKAAFFGGDPYTGRIVCAAGYSGAVFEPAKLDVFLDDVQVVRRGVEVVGSVEARASKVVARPEFSLTIDLHAGRAVAHRMASDLSVDYVRFNSDYRT
ncbi:MAG: bifunctional glutamate N-acetyltransferase/amino-acid acetyltransferase ArgJ [Deltaproteobacteria bacterium]|nr:bifunctional glutamate N-acetyltransferase/amino-acid acetyltransferase ArgJ [Deltaproteobacteria bacterium]MBI3391507.1 bifunctional glutamate N-acetyltransferase/amino-acid acetyltransferase ArgJ [Deltaproteobacteria bacterium]